MMKILAAVLLLCGGALGQQFLACPDDWIPYQERCYQFNYFPFRKYDDASRACQQNGAILLSVEDDAEHQFVTTRLRTTDVQRYNWYTSGERDSSSAIAKYVWTATNKEISLYSSMWISAQEPLNTDITKDLVVYKFDELRGLFRLATASDRSEPRPYICEIDRNEVYRINTNPRGFDYGVPYKNINDVKRGPRFLLEASSTVVILDQQNTQVTGLVYMECIASGIPQPDYNWIRNSSGLIEQITSVADSRYTVTNGKLTIENPEEKKDAGVYQCKVSNSEGAIISAPAQLSFASLGQFPNIEPEPVFPTEYQGAVIECPNIPSRFSQAIVYQWKKAEKDIFSGPFLTNEVSDVRPELNKHIFVSNNGRLYFSEVTDADNYIYYCIATMTTLNLNQDYISTTYPPSRTSKGIKLLVRSSSGGSYEPRIQDSFINVVPGSPVVGMNISLECFAYGTMPLQYYWNVPTSVEGRYTLTDQNRILKIQNVQQDDSGKYTCTVISSKNIGSRMDAKSYILYVESKPQFIMPLTDQHLDVNTRQLTWRCEARAVPFPTYTWYKNGEMLKNSTDGNRLIFGNTLYLRNLEAAKDAGVYQCVAQNSHGVSSTSAQLRILSVAPSFAKYPLSETLAGAIGGNLTIMCRPEAAPFPEITWYKNGGNLNPATDTTSRVRMTIEGDLHINDLNAGDAGTYECRAVNALGEDRNRTIVSILPSTTLYQISGPQSVEVNKTGYMFCRASFNQNNLDLTYRWAFNGRYIDVEDDLHFRRGTGVDGEGGLYLLYAQYDHSGTYTCVAQTQVDHVNRSTTLLVTGPPGEPAGLLAYSAMEKLPDEAGVRDVVLKWIDPMDTHGAALEGYRIRAQTNYSEEWKVIVSYVPQPSTIIPGGIDSQRRQTIVPNLKPAVAYRFKLMAINRFGIGMESKPTSFIVIPGAPPSMYPANIGGGGGSVGTLTITWDALPPEDHHGPGIGYEVEYRKRPPPGQLESNIKWNKIIIQGNVGEASALVGRENFFLEYQIKVTPFNIHGKGPTGQNDTVYSAEDLPIGIPSNVYAEPFNESAIIVRWDPVPETRDFMKGQLKGYKIDYWLKPPNSTRTPQTGSEEYRDDNKQAIIYGRASSGMVIGLYNNTWYIFTVTVFNNAGNGLKSEVAYQKTDRAAPRNYPVHINIYPYGENSIKVKFRGAMTTVYEEPLLGYKIRYWRDTDNIRNAKDVDCERNTEGIVYKIQSGTLYHLRVLGYSLGGDGKLSSPETLFTYTNYRVVQIAYDPSIAERVFVFHDAESAAAPAISSVILTITTMLAALLLI